MLLLNIWKKNIDGRRYQCLAHHVFDIYWTAFMIEIILIRSYILILPMSDSELKKNNMEWSEINDIYMYPTHLHPYFEAQIIWRVQIRWL